MDLNEKAPVSIPSFSLLLFVISLLVASCGTPPGIILEVPLKEAQVGQNVPIVAKVELLEEKNLAWTVSGTADGKLNTYIGGQVVYVAAKPGTDIVVVEGTTTNGVHIKQTITLTITGKPQPEASAIPTSTQTFPATVGPEPTLAATVNPSQTQTVAPTTTIANGGGVPALTKDSPIAIFKTKPKNFYKGREEDAVVTTLDRGNSLAYQFTYNLPTDESLDGYHAGFGFYAEGKPEDLSKYDYIDVTIIFGDEQAKCQLFLREDEDHQPQYIPLDSPPRDIIEDKGLEKTIRIPLGLFDRIDLKNVGQIGFNTKTDFTRGKHTFTIEGISFSKK